MNNFLKKGGWAGLLFILLTQTAFAASYAGNIYIGSSISGTPYLIQDNSPVSGTALKSDHNMPAGSNYSLISSVTLADGTTWKKFNIMGTSVASVYVLLINGSQYSLQGPFALGTTKPEESYIKSATYYNNATPPTPTATLTLGGLTYPSYNGIVSSGIGGIDPTYQPTGTKYALYLVTGGTDGKSDGTLGASAVVSGGGNLSNYEILNSKNNLYRVKMAYVNWFTTTGKENWGESKNLLIPSTGGALTETTLTLSFSKPSNKTGINTFTIPFVVSKGIKLNDSTSAEAALSVGQLINAINVNKAVTVFGWYDNTSQQHIGFTSIPGGDLTNAVPTGKKFDAVSGVFSLDSNGKPINYIKDEILAMMVVKNQPHQVSVTSGVTLKLTGFTQ